MLPAGANTGTSAPAGMVIAHPVIVTVQLADELAVMFDTQYPLQLTAAALAHDDPDYPLSWLE